MRKADGVAREAHSYPRAQHQASPHTEFCLDKRVPEAAALAIQHEQPRHRHADDNDDHGGQPDTQQPRPVLVRVAADVQRALVT